MKPETLYQIIDKEVLPRCMKIMKSKGMSYSGKEDKLGNFKRVAEKVGKMMSAGADPVIIVWYVYFCKHLDALESFLRKEYSDSEPIEGRIDDLINYLFLLVGIKREAENDARPTS